MRLFTLIDYQHLVLGLFLGCGGALLIYLAFAYPASRGPKAGEQGEGGSSHPDYPEGLKIGENPVPPLLIVLFFGFIAWLFVYVVFFAVPGGPV
jgi:hypothetical protein